MSSTSSAASSPTPSTADEADSSNSNDDDDDISLWPEDEAPSDQGTPPKPKKRKREQLNHELCAADLREWQEKFANAADRGSDDLREQVEDISKNLIETEIRGVGESLLVQLEARVKSGIEILQDDIKSAVVPLPEDLTEESVQNAYEKVNQAVQAAGTRIREKALEVRNWRTEYDQKAIDLVKSASTSTLNVLDDIYGLGLSQIGMKWAWADGVTYKDWEKYNEMKTVMMDWKKEVSEVAWKHERLQQGREDALRIEEQAMAIAEDAAKELRRLKDVARWKINTQDVSDDFSSKPIPPPIYNAAKKAAEEAAAASAAASEAINEATPDSVESADDVVESATSIVDEQTASAAGTVSSMVEDVSEQATEAASEVSESAETVLSAAKEKATEASPPIGTPEPPSDESVEEQDSADAESLPSTPSEPVIKQPKVPGGAMAFFVEAREPILEDALEDELINARSILSDAGNKIAALTEAVFEALQIPTGTDTAATATPLPTEAYGKALAAALNALYGVEKGAESLTDAGKDRYADAMTA
jgi:hypothetical protein